MIDIVTMDHLPTPEYPYSVVWRFPCDLNREEIFKNNLSHSLDDLKEWIRETNLLKENIRIMDILKFDSQKNEQLKLIRENEKKILEIKNKMNNDISPYFWCIMRDFEGYVVPKRYIKVDYLLILDKK